MKVNVKVDNSQALVIWAFNVAFGQSGDIIPRVHAGMFAIDTATLIRLYDEGQLFLQISDGMMHCVPTPELTVPEKGTVYTLYSDKDGIWLREYVENETEEDGDERKDD